MQYLTYSDHGALYNYMYIGLRAHDAENMAAVYKQLEVHSLYCCYMG